MMEKDAHLGIVNMVINVQDRIHLANVIKRLRTIKAISRIIRVRN
jgi:guanosine-3',5'-bis(diphosphate) 3'-pyrophosphohydrolase